MAARSLAQDVADGQLRPEDIDEAAVAARVALADQPPPDLFIRTGGDMRIRNVLLWQLAYTELWFTEIGRAACRERVCQDGWRSVVAGSSKQQETTHQVEHNHDIKQK